MSRKNILARHTQIRRHKSPTKRAGRGGTHHEAGMGNPMSACPPGMTVGPGGYGCFPIKRHTAPVPMSGGRPRQIRGQVSYVNPGGNYVPGCTDPQGCNYNPQATLDDGSCAWDLTSIGGFESGHDCSGVCIPAGNSNYAVVDGCGLCTCLPQNTCCGRVCSGNTVCVDCQCQCNKN